MRKSAAHTANDRPTRREFSELWRKTAQQQHINERQCTLVKSRVTVETHVAHFPSYLRVKNSRHQDKAAGIIYYSRVVEVLVEHVLC